MNKCEQCIKLIERTLGKCGSIVQAEAVYCLAPIPNILCLRTDKVRYMVLGGVWNGALYFGGLVVCCFWWGGFGVGSCWLKVGRRVATDGFCKCKNDSPTGGPYSHVGGEWSTGEPTGNRAMTYRYAGRNPEP